MAFSWGGFVAAAGDFLAELLTDAIMEWLSAHQTTRARRRMWRQVLCKKICNGSFNFRFFGMITNSPNLGIVLWNYSRGHQTCTNHFLECFKTICILLHKTSLGRKLAKHQGLSNVIEAQSVKELSMWKNIRVTVHYRIALYLEENIAQSKIKVKDTSELLNSSRKTD